MRSASRTFPSVNESEEPTGVRMRTMKRLVSWGGRNSLRSGTIARARAGEQSAVAADTFKKAGLEVYTPDLNAFRAYAQKVYLASDEAKAWAPGILDKIAAVK